MTYCERCDRYFGSWSALYRHRADSSRHNVCGDCSKDFSTWTGLKEHWVQSPRHPYCQRCNEHFDDFSELDSHYEDSHYYCSRCEIIFTNEYGLQEHYRQSNFHYYCSPCKRLFQSESNLKSVYQYHRNLSIPFLLIDYLCSISTLLSIVQRMSSALSKAVARNSSLAPHLSFTSKKVPVDLESTAPLLTDMCASTTQTT